MTLLPSRFSLLLPLALSALPAGCGRTEPAIFPTASELPSGHRRPDGVALDLAQSPPSARENAGSEDGLVTLRTPLGNDVALATIATLFQRIVREDAEGLDQVFTRDAVAVMAQGTTTGSMGGGMSATPSYSLYWANRFHKLDYTKLAGETIYRESEASVYRAEDLKNGVPLPEVRPDGLSDTDVVIRVPIAMPRVGLDRLLGDEIFFWLRREGGTFKIYRTLEDFQLP